MRIAGDAGRKAMADAGLEPSEIDGLMSYQMSDSVDSHSVATYLGITPRFYDDVVGGGSATETLVAEVIALIELGVVLPYKLSSAGENDGMIASRHMYETGTTEEHLGAVCISICEQARANPRARFYGHPLTIEQYLSSPHISGPYRIHDYCTETDEGNALIMTSAARARNCKTTPDYVQHFAVRGSVSARPSVRLARHNRDGRGPRRPTGVRDGRRWSRRHPRDGLLRLLQLGRTRATRLHGGTFHDARRATVAAPDRPGHAAVLASRQGAPAGPHALPGHPPVHASPRARIPVQGQQPGRVGGPGQPDHGSVVLLPRPAPLVRARLSTTSPS